MTSAKRQRRYRASVAVFGARMEKKLLDNDHKGGWGKCSVAYLLGRLCQEASELVQSFDVSRTNGHGLVGPREAFVIAAHHLDAAADVLLNTSSMLGTRGRVRIAHPDTRNDDGPADEAADVANLCLMISEVSRRLGVVRLPRERRTDP